MQSNKALRRSGECCRRRPWATAGGVAGGADACNVCHRAKVMSATSASSQLSLLLLHRHPVPLITTAPTVVVAQHGLLEPPVIGRRGVSRSAHPRRRSKSSSRTTASQSSRHVRIALRDPRRCSRPPLPAHPLRLALSHRPR